MFDHRQWTRTFIESPGYNDAAKYGVFVVENEGPWKVIGVHHLTPEENHGECNIYIDCLNESGRRAKSEKVNWDWEGRRSDEEAQPVRMDKPVSEVPNIPIDSVQKISSIWHPDGESVLNLHTSPADEAAPGGEKWNSIGHHSFFIVFQKMRPGQALPKPDPILIEEPIIPVGVGLEYKFIVPERGADQMKALEDESTDGWIAYAAAVINGRVHHYLRRVANDT